MAQVTQHAPGTPSWIELSTFDPGDAARFYGSLFGWTVEADGLPADGRQMCTYHDHPVAGIGPRSPAAEAPRWLTYVTVADAGATAEIIMANGGSLIVPPVDVGGADRTAVAADPNGAVFAIWEATSRIGPGIGDQPNTVCWFELTTRHKDVAIAFYHAVFDWRPHHHGDAPGDYVEFHLDDQSVAGLLPAGHTSPADEPGPDAWTVYFAVDDVDATTTRVGQLGGSTVVPPSEIFPGRFATLNDPQGATFSVLMFRAEAA